MEKQTITVLLNMEDDFETITEYEFSVDAWWFLDYLKKNGIADMKSFTSFMESYTSDDAMEIYVAALLDDVIIGELVQVIA